MKKESLHNQIQFNELLRTKFLIRNYPSTVGRVFELTNTDTTIKMVVDIGKQIGEVICCLKGDGDYVIIDVDNGKFETIDELLNIIEEWL
jgi:hypothetical protein